MIICFFGLGLVPRSVSAQSVNSFSLPAVTLPQGSVGANLFLKCDHDVVITAFSVSIRCDPLKLAVAEVTTAGTNAENPDFFDGRNNHGELTFGVVLGISPTSFKTLPPASDHTLLRLTLDVMMPAPGIAPLTFVDGLDGGNFPISNVITDQIGNSFFPALIDGSVTVVDQGGAQKPGDMNQDGKLNISDPVALLDHLFLGTPKYSKLPCEHGTAAAPGAGDRALIDVDGNTKINIGDAIYLLNYLFIGGPKPLLGGLEDPCVLLGGCSSVCL